MEKAETYTKGLFPKHQFFTPEWAAAQIVEERFPELSPECQVVELSAGLGSFLKAIPPQVPALGVEIDPNLAKIAAESSGREVLIGDFTTLPLDCQPTHIIGNPPFQSSTIDAFLARAAELLPDNGRCGLILPAYTLSYSHRMQRLEEDWHVSQELLPLELFPRLSLPIVFALFTRSRAGGRSKGFLLFPSAAAIRTCSKTSRLILCHGRPGKGVWRALVDAAMSSLGGRASTEAILSWVTPKAPATNRWISAKIRQILKEEVDRGRYRRLQPGMFEVARREEWTLRAD